MTIDFILPDIGEGIVECELLEWLIAEGDVIEEDQPVAEVMTDKATVQIPAMHAGTVRKLHYQVGEIAKVHSPLFSMDTLEQTNQPEEQTMSTEDLAEDDAAQEQEPTSSTSKASTSAAEDFILPDIGEGIVECEIVKWHVNEGDAIEEDQVVVEVMTDKAVVEIPAKHSGVVSKLYHGEGEIAKVHTPLFALVSNHQAEVVTETVKASVAPVSENSVTHSSDKESKFADGAYEPPVAIDGKVLASPAIRRMARERNIDLNQVQGSGKKGRILKRDLSVAVSVPNQQQTSAIENEKPVPTSKHAANIATGGIRTEPMRGIRAAMAKQMSASVHTIPHFTVTDELNMDALIALRKSLKPEFEAKGTKLSFMPFFVKALSLALSEFPIINTQLNDDASELTYFDDHNIGFAVDSKIGLMVPNIKRVQDKSLLDIAQEMQTIIDLAREGRLASDMMTGGTISISNIGAIGGMVATPVINKPEAAIVALGKTQTLPRFDESGEVTAVNLMTVNWSGDHRIIDGATMVRFNNLWMDYLQHPTKMLMHLK